MKTRLKNLFLLFVMLSIFPISKILSQNTQNNIASSADAICPIKIGAELPALMLSTSEGKTFNVNEAIQKKPAVLVIYRGGWCPYCSNQLKQLMEIEPKLLSLGYQILAISTDIPEKLQETQAKEKLNYMLLSDNKMTACSTLGIAYKVEEEVVKKYKSYNMDLELASGEKHHLLPVPSVFIVGTDGIIKFSYSNPNYKVRLDPDVMLAAATAGLK